MKHIYEELDFNDEDWKQFHRLGDEHQFAANTTIFKARDRDDSLYLLKTGTIRVETQERTMLYHAPSFFGEMALFNRSFRTASVIAVNPVTVIRIPSSILLQGLASYNTFIVKFMHAIGNVMLKRLESSIAQVSKDMQGEKKDLSPLLILKKNILQRWALTYHSLGEPGKINIMSSKPVGSKQDLSVAYSPGVAAPCLIINKNKMAAYDVTTKGNLVGIITNATAVLGLGTLSAVASKPVMEGKAILFKNFANINAFDLEINENNPKELIKIVKSLEPTFGGINLEDIKAPECFYIEDELKKIMDIPVFHDDQHGTAIIVGAGLKNALKLQKKEIDNIKVVICGAGAAGVACAKFLILLGLNKNNLMMVDINGVISKDRVLDDSLKQFAIKTPMKTLSEAVENADVFIGLSAPKLLTPNMLLSMNKNPIVFALANPVPEIDYQLAKSTRKDIIIATGRSDYPNQINNVMAFPFIFRGALDVRACKINEEMKLAASDAIVKLATKIGVTEGSIIPSPFHEKLLSYVSLAVAKAAIETNVARIEIDMKKYHANLLNLEKRLQKLNEL